MTYGMAYGIPHFLMPFWGFTILLGSCDNDIHLSAPPWPCHLHHRRCRSGPGTLGNQWMSTINDGLTIKNGKTWNYGNKMRCRWSDLRPFPADVPFNQFWMKSEAQWEKMFYHLYLSVISNPPIWCHCKKNKTFFLGLFYRTHARRQRLQQPQGRFFHPCGLCMICPLAYLTTGIPNLI